MDAIEFVTIDESTWDARQYELLDFGQGRKLERFGRMIVDRPCPAAECRFSQPDIWKRTQLRFDNRQWHELTKQTSSTESNWTVDYRKLVLRLKPTPFGHVGLFPEQAENWSWLSRLIANWNKSTRPKALNLFAYTGGATLALADAGAEVVHCDASEPAVRWARSNASLSRLENTSIRWIVDDARDFVRRELKRNRQYDLIVMDPPTFGHGSRGMRWEIQNDLPQLLAQCVQLLADSPAYLLITGHSEYPTPDDIRSNLVGCLEGVCAVQRSQLYDLAGRCLDCSYAVRVVKRDS